MQPSLSLIAAGITAAIALSPLGAKSSQAASLSEADPYSEVHQGEAAALLSTSSASAEALEIAQRLDDLVSAPDASEVEFNDAENSNRRETAEETASEETAAVAETLESSDVDPGEAAELTLDAAESASEEAADAPVGPASEPDASEPNGEAVEPEGEVERAEVKPDAVAQETLDSEVEDLETEVESIEDSEIQEAIESDLSETDLLREQEERSLPDLSEPVDPAIFGLDDDETPVLYPEYLNSPANPLTFPTEPEEVELSGTQPITLEQAIEIARRNSTELQEALLQLEQSRAALRQEQARYLPNLNADLTLTHQGTNSFEAQQFANPETGELEISSTSVYSEATTLNGGLNLTFDIYTSGQRSSLVRAAEERVRLQELQVEVVAEQLRLDVTQDYYDLQETDELVRIATQSLDEALQSLRDAQALERAGVGTRFDSLQAEVEVANSRQDLIQSLSDQEIARRQLSQRLNSYQSIDLAAADPIEVAGLWEIPLEESIVLAYQNRAELEQQLVQRDISEQQRRANLSVLGPQLSAFAQYNFADLLDETESPGDSETYAVGLQATLQLYDGGAARAAARQEEINIALAENTFEETQRIVRFQVEQSFSALQANFENIQTASIAVDTATEALRLARLRFQAGVGTQTEVLEAQTDLTRAEVNRLQAVLGYNRALAQLQRSVSNLPDSDLSDRP